MSDVFAAAVERLTRIAGVLGALIVDRDTAVPVVAELSDGVEGAALAALAASLFQRMRQGAESAQLGRLGTLQLEADAGHVVVADAGELIVVVIAEHGAQLGLVRLEAARAAQSLA
jgi:predicted regulator of Ras-like GTPase activity (Roadblock/LC7/MglB family)